LSIVTIHASPRGFEPRAKRQSIAIRTARPAIGAVPAYYLLGIELVHHDPRAALIRGTPIRGTSIENSKTKA
jgi:hypothetical protein